MDKKTYNALQQIIVEVVAEAKLSPAQKDAVSQVVSWIDDVHKEYYPVEA